MRLVERDRLAAAFDVVRLVEPAGRRGQFHPLVVRQRHRHHARRGIAHREPEPARRVRGVVVQLVPRRQVAGPSRRDVLRTPGEGIDAVEAHARVGLNVVVDRQRQRLRL